MEHDLILIYSNGAIFNSKSFKVMSFPRSSIDAGFVIGQQSKSYDVEYVYEYGKIIITKLTPHGP